MRITTGLYVKNSAEAVALYCEAFGLTLGYHVLNPDGSYFHSELYRGDQELLSVVEAADPPLGNHTVQVGVILDGEAEVRRAFSLLRPGGTVETPLGPLPWSPCAAVVLDRFGVWWYISAPQHYPPKEYDPAAPWTPDMYKKPEEQA